jgi:opacity protein-like surface antigen
MKRSLAAAVLILLGLASSAPAAVVWRTGLGIGPQHINDPKIRSTYGQQAVFRPSVEAAFGRHLSAGLAYEFGYRRDGRIGIDLLPTSLSMSGINLALGYEIPIGSAALYGRAGYGLYFYKQTIDGSFLVGHEVDRSQSTIVAGVGVRIRAGRSFFLSGEAEVVPLKVRPYDVTVDLGGFRLFFGAGFVLNPPAGAR